MRNCAQVIFDLVHVLRVEAPIVIAKFIKTSKRVALDSSGHVDVRIEITPDQISDTSKQRFLALESLRQKRLASRLLTSLGAIVLDTKRFSH